MGNYVGLHDIMEELDREGIAGMQWIAVVTMLIDHIGIVWFPDSPLWRIVGRLAFPIYTYFIALGMTRTRSLPNYVRRLTVLALLSQAPFALLFDTWTVNVIGTFAVSVGALVLMERMPRSNPLRYAWPVAAALLMEAVSFDYGAYGLLLLVLYRYTQSHTTVLGHLALNGLYLILYATPLQLFSILPTLAFAYAPGLSAWSRAPVPRWLWRFFYPVHLTVLLILVEISRRNMLH